MKKLKKIVSLLLVLFLSTAMSCTAVAAEEEDIQAYDGWLGPDNMFYGLKIALQNVNEERSPTAEAKLKLKIAHAEERIAEAKAMEKKGKAWAFGKAMDRYNEKIEDINETLESVNMSEEGLEHAIQTMSRHRSVLQGLIDDPEMPEQARKGLQNALEKSNKTACALTQAKEKIGGASKGLGKGTFRLQVTDQPSAIGDFESLNVTVSEVRVHRALAGNETNETGEWITFEPSNQTFDLTKLQEGNVTTIVNESVEAGNYTQVRLIVESAEGFANENLVNVNVPSGTLKIVKPFVIAANQTTTFLFDINVVKTGKNYNLLPVIGKSGV
jgi:hypothetical protein